MKKKPQKSNIGKLVKIYFDLEPSEDEFPPAKTEFLWCIPTKRGTYIVDNIPFFVRNISLGDEVSAQKSGRGLHFLGLVHESRNSTVRVLLKKIERIANIRENLDRFGCGTELMDELGLLAVSMSPDSKIADSLSYLDEEATKGNVGIEESAVRYK